MTRRTIGLLVILALGFLVAPLAAEAQPPTKVHRIGWLHPGLSRPEPHPSLETFRQGLREFGYVEGQNLVIESRFAEGRDERLADLAAELVRLQVDMLVAAGTAAIQAAQRATRTIPIVMAATSDPVGRGFVASMARPGGNTTGLSLLNTELPGKRLELLKETVPQSTRIAVLANPASPGFPPLLHNLTVTAETLKLSLHVVEVHRAEALDDAFAAMTRAGADALIVFAEPQVITPQRGRIAALAATSRLPAMYDNKTYVEAGGLMSYGAHLPDMYRRAVTYVDKILKGAKPADLPVEQPTKFELVINLKTARALGMTMPPSLLLLADEVIQ
jgi:putative tryptophan/tyrosine transport system substrate-binding protein